MIKIYFDDISTIDYKEVFDSIFDTLPKSRQDRVNSYKNEKDKKLSLLGSRLLVKGLKKLGFDNCVDKIETDENGKPYIPGTPVYFSISHSGDMVMVAVCRFPIGCDIQFVEKNNIELAKRYFNENEIEEINDSDDPIRCFYKYWTIKESYMKLTGKGLSLGLKNAPIKNGVIDIENCGSFTQKIGNDYIASYVFKKPN